MLIVAILLVMLAGCSLTLPGNSTNNDSPVIILNDTFLFTDEEPVNTGNGASSTEDTLDTEPNDDTSEPVLSTITVVEGEVARLDFLTANDPDGDSIEFIYGEPFARDGTWQTADGDQGTYIVPITATDGVLTTTENVRIVVTPSNKGPVINCPPSLSISEGERGEIDCTIYDAEGDEFTYTVSGYLDSLAYETDYEDAGTYQVTVTATDGNKETSADITLRVANVNRQPVVQAVSKITVVEGETVILSIIASDPDNDRLEVTYPILFDEDGVWVTKKGDAGNYELEAEVSDGEATVRVPISMIVEKINLPPTMTTVDTIEVDEGQTIVIDVEAEDEEGDELTITYEGFMSESTYTTTYEDAGEHSVTVTVTDGKHTITQDIAIVVHNVNRPPVFIVN